MAYTNGIFRIDLVNGSDAARATFAGGASNPAGSTTRITKLAHGLVTGAVVDLTAFTAWLNGAWKITVVNADSFDLDDAVWQATADPNGTVAPRGGSSWSDAWLTITTGATAARVQPGDEVRISKTADAASLAIDATFTDGSSTVTLASANTKKIEDAVTGWTASGANITLVASTTRKIGATAITLTPAAAFTTGLAAYKAIAGGGTQDFSGYTHLNFWIRPTSAAAIPANTWQIALCSDAVGAVPVSTFNIPAIAANTSFQPMVIDLGAAMGASIQSVAIIAALDPGTTAFSINNIFASTSAFNLKGLIGPQDDVFYNLQSVDGVTLKIDSNSTNLTGRGWSGTTTTEPLYFREGFGVTTTTTWATISEAGDTTAQRSHYTGGWNTASDTLDGVTVISSNILGVGTFLTTLNYLKISNIVAARFAGVSVTAYVEFNNVAFLGATGTFGITNATGIILRDCKFYNLSTAPSITIDAHFINTQFRNNTLFGCTVSIGNRFTGCTFANNGSGAMNVGVTLNESQGAILLRNTTISDSTEIAYASAIPAGFIWSFDHDNTPANHRGFTQGATVNWQTTEKQGADTGSWKVAVTSALRTQYLPVIVKIGEVYCSASALVTFKAWVKKDHATNIGASLFVEDALYNIDGVVATETTKASDTAWEELTITFTPTEAGIVPVYGKVWYVAGTSNAYFGSIDPTQA